MTAHPRESDLQELLAQGASALGVHPEPRVLESMLRHLNLLVQAGRRADLTSLHDPTDIAIYHFLDSLSVFKVLPYGKDLSLLDVGAGGGFPGLVMRTADPSKHLTLLDRNPRKIVFLKLVAKELGLTDVRFINRPLNDLFVLPESPRFDVVISRAFSSELKVLETFSELIHAQGQIVRMAGPASSGEDFPLATLCISDVWEGNLPYSTHVRRIIVYSRKS
jgi:16S rRNA (guanine527-N7)-methyltransferase